MTTFAYNTSDIVGRLERKLPKGLFEHCHRVSEIASDLGPRHGCAKDISELTAWVHDVCRHERGEKLISLAHDFGIPVTPLDERAPVLLHGPVGAELLRREWGITDADILNAVWWHTTGRKCMSVLERVLFMSDKLDPTKDKGYSQNERVRTMVQTDLNGALLEWMSAQVGYQLSHGETIHPTLVEARNALIIERG